MLTMTETAGARLTGLLNDSAGDAVVRIVRRKRGLKLRLDHERPDDATFVHEGRTVLVLDERMSLSLSSRTLDVHQTDTGPRLSLKPR